jgi:hypothetical protein
MPPTAPLACGVGAGGRGGGALYTGRGPVWGTIIRGLGGCGGPATTGGAGRGAAGGAWGLAEATGAGVLAGATGGATTADEGGGGGVAGRGGTGAGGAGTAAAGAGLSTGGATADRTAGAGGGGTAAIGVGAGVGADVGGGVGFTGAGAGGATTGFITTGGAAGRAGGGAAAASFFCVMAFSTSPGREMCDRSILVLISSSPRKGRELRADELCASAEPRIWARTFSASWSSMELECVFFSVTPTCGSASRMALLLTSSSLARSFIRTLLIRPFVSSALGIHRNLTEPMLGTRTLSNLPARAMLFSFFGSGTLRLALLIFYLF